MKKIAEFKQNRFVFRNDENIVHDYIKPTYCKLYKTETGYKLIKFINNIEVTKFKYYEEAKDAFNIFVTINLCR